MSKLQHSVGDLIRLSTQYLSEKGCTSPRLDAEVLLGHVLGLSRVEIYLNLDKPLTNEEVDQYRVLIGRRGQRIPVAYLTGNREFYSLPLTVQPGVLIPRPETELLVEKVIQLVADSLDQEEEAISVLELGTGSGAIALALACESPCIQVTAVDISSTALQTARLNAERLEVTDQIQFVQSDLFNNVDGTYFIICSNPPYIPSQEMLTLQPEVSKEPTVALDGGEDGLTFYRRIMDQAASFLEQPGFVVLEIGWNQGNAVRQMGESKGFQWLETIPDYGDTIGWWFSMALETIVLSPHELDKAAQLLRTGEVVAFPTETVYGLGRML